MRRFCENEGFDRFSSDHDYYDKTFQSGETAGTKISRGVEGETLDPGMWQMVWKRQLRLRSEEDFWRGVRGESVTYDIPPPPAASEPLPGYLRRYLANIEHLDDAAIARIPKDEAMDRYQRHLARETGPPTTAEQVIGHKGRGKYDARCANR